MVFLLILIFGLILTVGFLSWLGWGRTRDWKITSGWYQLDVSEREHFRASAQTYAALPGMPVVTWHGHASMEVQWADQRVLFDPVGSSRISIVPRRFHQPVLDPLQPATVICLSHAHMDHFDNQTLRKIPPARLILPKESERFLNKTVVQRHRIEPFEIGQALQIGPLELIPVEAVHGGWRYPWQRGLFACGFILRLGNESIYIAGDSAAGPHFARIGGTFSPRIAVLPIGAYSPQWLLRKRHLNPEEALEAASVLGAEFVVPCHFGTYRLSLEPMNEPLRRFARGALARRQAAFISLPEDPELS